MGLPDYLLPLTASHTRKTDVLQASTSFPFTASPGESYEDSLRVKCVCSGISTTCDVAIVGQLNGASASETLSIPVSGSKVRMSVGRYDYLTSISSATTIDGSIVVYATTEGGQPYVIDSTVESSLKGRLRQSRRPVLVARGEGFVVEEIYIFYCNATNLLAGDRLTISGTTYRVDGEVVLYDKGSTHHTEAVVRKI